MAAPGRARHRLRSPVPPWSRETVRPLMVAAAKACEGLTGPSAVTGTTSSGASSGAAGAPAPVPAQSAEQVLGPGITPTTIYFGAEYSSRASTESKAIGASGAATSYDFRDIVNTIVHYANLHGGFASRKLQVIYHDVNDNNNRDIEDQSACSDVTHRAKVY